MPWTVSSFKSLPFLWLNIYPVLRKDPISAFNVKIINFPKCNFWLIYINYHCCHRRKISMSIVTHYYMAYFKCVFTRNLSLHTLWSIFWTAWTSRVIKLSDTRLLKSSNKFLSIKKQMKGIQMSFPIDWFLKSCTMSARTSRDEVPEEAAVSSPPVSTVCIWWGSELGFRFWCPRAQSLQGHSQWVSHLAFKFGGWMCVALIIDLFAMV